MTQPSEEAIRKACEEAGVVEKWADLSQQLPDAVIPRLVLALARRIEAEAVPVAVIGKDYRLLWASQDTVKAIVDRTGISVGSLLYAHPPKEPTT